MTTTAIDRPQLDPSVVQQVLLAGDLSKLTAEQRVSYYNRVCESLGLNPLTQPFAYLKLSGKEILYAKKDCTDQLRFIHQISIDPKTFTREVIEGIYIVTAAASMPTGRTDVSTGAVPIEGLRGEARANALMKSETKAKRRVTLSICGLGMLDETEIETIPQAEPIVVDTTPAALPPPPEGAVYLAKLETKHKGKHEWADVLDSHGELYIVLGTRLVALLEQLIQEKAPVVLETRTTKKGYREIVKATRWAPPAPADPVGIVPVEEIPFAWVMPLVLPAIGLLSLVTLA